MYHRTIENNQNILTGEFEAGFESGGQTREHALLVRSDISSYDFTSITLSSVSDPGKNITDPGPT